MSALASPWPLAALAAALLGLALAGAVLGLRRRARRLERLLADSALRLEGLQLQFQRFAPDVVVEQLTDAGTRIAPNRREVTVLFADLQGFTSMCDRLDPMDTVRILNGYFQCMSEAITRHHGRITELIGDGLLALFGALGPNPWQARDAVLGALDMRAELARYNAELRAQALPELRFGVGIHRGEVVAGIMGNDTLSKFGVVGDTINVASRVEGLTRVHAVDLLVTEEVRAALDPSFVLRGMPATAVKGKAHPIVTYHVEGLATEPQALAVQPTASR
jgi:class 3 adenylate cyclase